MQAKGRHGHPQGTAGVELSHRDNTVIQLLLVEPLLGTTQCAKFYRIQRMRSNSCLPGLLT